MQVRPAIAREYLLEVGLGLLDVLALRQAPARGEPMNVRVDRKRRLAEGLSHDHARGLVPDAGQRLERLEVARVERPLDLDHQHAFGEEPVRDPACRRARAS